MKNEMMILLFLIQQLILLMDLMILLILMRSFLKNEKSEVRILNMIQKQPIYQAFLGERNGKKFLRNLSMFLCLKNFLMEFLRTFSFFLKNERPKENLRMMK
jgi:hypothetical protein